jgi:hypothetical protein
LGLLEISLQFGELQRKLFVFFLRFFQVICKRSNISILFLDESRERLAVLVFLGILEILRLSNHSYPNFSQKLANSCVEFLKDLSQIFAEWLAISMFL